MKKWMILPAAVLSLVMISETTALAEDSQGERKGRLAQVDTNGDGVISMDEHLAVAKERFGKIDTDGDGSLSREEIKAGREARKEKRQERRAQRREESPSQFTNSFSQ